GIQVRDGRHEERYLPHTSQLLGRQHRTADLELERRDEGDEVEVAAALAVPIDRALDVDASRDRKSTRLNSSHVAISYAVFCLKDPPTPHAYTLSLHDALPIFGIQVRDGRHEERYLPHTSQLLGRQHRTADLELERRDEGDEVEVAAALAVPIDRALDVDAS